MSNGNNGIIAPPFNPFSEATGDVIAPPFNPLGSAAQTPAFRPEPVAERPQMTRHEQLADALATGASGIARGVVGIPGTIGTAAQIYDIAPAALQYAYSRLAPAEWGGGKSREEASRAYDQAMERLRSTQSEREQQGLERRILGIPFPTSSGLVREYTPYLEREGETPVARIAGVAGEFLGSSPAGAPIKAIRMAQRIPGAASEFSRATAIPSTAAGVASGAAGEATAGNEFETAARIAAGVAGGAAGSLGQARLLPSAQRETALRIAGDVARSQLTEQPTRWERYRRNITGRLTPAEQGAVSALDVPPGEFAPGVTPTPAQLLPGEVGLRGLERREPVPGAPTASGTRESSRLALQDETSQAPGIAAQSRIAPTMADVLDLPIGNNPMGQSSVAARNVFDAVHDAAFQAKEDAWKNPAIAQAQYKPSEVRTALANARSQMGDATYQNMPVELRRYVENLETYTGGVPLTELQKVKEFANTIMRSPNVLDKSGAAALTTILDDVMTNTGNVLPRFMSGATYTQAAPAWDAARTATRKYYENFGTDLLQNLAERYSPGTSQAGASVIPAVQMLDRVLGNPRDALKNFENISSIPGIDNTALNQAVGDWIVGKLTNNGQNINVTQGDISRFLRSPGNSEIVSRIPGLEDRLNNIATQSRADRVIGGFNMILQNPLNPEQLNKFIRTNRADLDQVFASPNQQAYLNRLERSSQVLQPLAEGSLSPSRVQAFLDQGDLFSVLHGYAGGILGRVGAGAATGAALNYPLGTAMGLELLGAGAGLAGVFPKATEIGSKIVYGPLQNQAAAILQRATTDPKLMQELMRKPTIQDLYNPFAVNGWAHFLTETAPGVGMDVLRGSREAEERRLPPRRAGGRVGRASGGRLVRNDHAARAAALIRAADAAKKAHNKTTEGILEQPDEAVAKALSIANQAI